MTLLTTLDHWMRGTWAGRPVALLGDHELRFGEHTTYDNQQDLQFMLELIDGTSPQRLLGPDVVFAYHTGALLSARTLATEDQDIEPNTGSPTGEATLPSLGATAWLERAMVDLAKCVPLTDHPLYSNFVASHDLDGVTYSNWEPPAHILWIDPTAPFLLERERSGKLIYQMTLEIRYRPRS